MLAQDPDPTEAGLFSELFSEGSEAASGAAQSAIEIFIEEQKRKAIAEAKAAVIPVALGLGALAGSVAGLAVVLIARRL